MECTGQETISPWTGTCSPCDDAPIVELVTDEFTKPQLSSWTEVTKLK